MSTLSIAEHEFAVFREYLADLCGILVGENKAYLIETRLGGLVRECGCQSFAEFHQRLKYGRDAALRERVVDLMTTNETLWFRDSHPFAALKNILLPEYARQAREQGRRALRIWSCACSTGQEPYSIAMTILEAARVHPELGQMNIEILASDISTDALHTARQGRYESLAMSRGLPESYRARYFRNEGRAWSIAPEVRAMVTFKKHNLQQSFAPLGRFDVVFCRNVAIYFSDGFKRDLFGRIALMLNPGGVLFLGASESLASYCEAFDMRGAAAGGVYYELRQRA